MHPRRPTEPGAAPDLEWAPEPAEFETVLGPEGVADLLSSLRTVADIPGDIVECGSWRGGSAMIMAEALRRRGSGKIVYACDSYEGFDLDELRRERDAGATPERDDAFASTSVKYVLAKVRERGLEGVVVPVKGYFEETLPGLDGRCAMVVVDCDLGASTLFAARTMWPRLSPGGVMLFDDYLNAERFSGARTAIDEFVRERRDEIDGHGLLARLYRVRKAPAIAS